MLREEKGITLVALIITIIVLIILAAVTIIAFRDSKLINTAINGTINYSNGQMVENHIVYEVTEQLYDALNRVNKALGGDGRVD